MKKSITLSNNKLIAVLIIIIIILVALLLKETIINGSCHKEYEISNVVGVYLHNFEDDAQYITVYKEGNIVVTDTGGSFNEGIIVKTDSPNTYVVQMNVEGDNNLEKAFMVFDNSRLFILRDNTTVDEYSKIREEPIIVESGVDM